MSDISWFDGKIRHGFLCESSACMKYKALLGLGKKQENLKIWFDFVCLI